MCASGKVATQPEQNLRRECTYVVIPKCRQSSAPQVVRALFEDSYSNTHITEATWYLNTEVMNN